MLKKMFTLFISAIVTAGSLSIGTVNVSAAEFMTTVRVGLEAKFAGVETVQFSDKVLTAGYERSGELADYTVLNSQAGFTVGYSNQYFVNTGTYAPSLDLLGASLSAYKNAGYTARPCFSAPFLWTVYIGGFSSANEAINTAAAIGTSASAVYSKRLITISDGSDIVMMFDSTDAFPQFCSPDGITAMGVRKYRGRIECGRYTGQNLTAVNVISTEKYLYGVVPSEMPSSWELEALKAQAVSARTYTQTRKGVHAAQGYDLCDGVHCQMYLGVTNESANATLAVDATQGIIAVYNGKAIMATYCASSGGYTDSSENVWTEALPYLRSVPDLYETTGKTWTRTFALNDISTLLTAKQIKIGTLLSVKLSEISASGRVQKLTFVGSSGSHTIAKEEIRTFFSSLPGGSLESRNFVMTDASTSSSSAQYFISNGTQNVSSALAPLYVQNAAGSQGTLSGSSIFAVNSAGIVAVSSAAVVMESTGATFTLAGKGSGHGVGMSQHGANGFAKNGYMFDQILKYYYTGIELEQH